MIEGSTNSALLKYTFENGNLELINRLGVTSVEAIALSLDAKILYAVQAGVFGILDTTMGKIGSFTAVNPAGIGTAHGENGWVTIDDVDGLSFDPTTGTLYATQRLFNSPDLLLKINPVTGKFIDNAFGSNTDYIVIGNNLRTADWIDIDDIAVDLDGNLHGTANYEGINDRFVRINKQTGVVTELNTIAINGVPLNDVEGLSHYKDNIFFGTTGIETGNQQGDNRNSFFKIRIDPMTSDKIINLDQNYNGYLPYDFEAIACRICRASRY